MTEEPLLLGTNTGWTRTLAAALSAELEPLPEADDEATLEAWRAARIESPSRSRVVVAVWPSSPDPAADSAALVDLGLPDWTARFERPYLAWSLALGAAAGRVADGGAIVAVVQTPAALEARGFVPEVAIGDGVVALVKSLAHSEGPRGVRANVVTTPTGLVAPDVIAPPPPLATFPGRLEAEVAGAVRMLLGDDAVGVTGRVLPADCGRSLP